MAQEPPASRSQEHSCRLIDMQYAKDHMFHPSEKAVTQELLLQNDGEQAWPANTFLLLTRAHTDINVARRITIGGEVPKLAQVRIKFRIAVEYSRMRHHAV